MLLIEGMLTDGAGRTLGDRYLEVTMNDQFLTGLQVEENGTFSVYLPIPPDMPLGPRLVKIIFRARVLTIFEQQQYSQYVLLSFR